MHKENLIDWNFYQCYEDGKILGKRYNKFLKDNIDKYGYVRVILKCVDGKQRHFQWHRVIWTAFNGEIPEGMQVNHINEVKTDNRLCNLEIVTPKENCNWGTRNERRATKRSKPVVAVDKDGNVVYEFLSTNEAGRNGFSQGNVSACCNNCYYGSNIYKGLRWYYA